MLSELVRPTKSAITGNINVMFHLQMLIQLILIVKVRPVGTIVADMVLARGGDVLLLSTSVWKVFLAT